MEKNIEMLKYNLKFSKFISLVSFILNVTINWLLQTGYELNWVWGYYSEVVLSGERIETESMR